MIKQIPIPIWIILSSCIVPIIIVIPIIYFYIMISNLKPKDKSFYTVENDDEKWIYGFIYYNKDDPKVMVEKRRGMGWNINMATLTAKIIAIMILVITIGSLLICFV